MGNYINKIKGTTLKARNKAFDIIRLANAIEISEPVSWEENLVCVIPTPEFDAAGYADTPDQLIEFKTAHSAGKKIWLIVPNAKDYIE